ncbi:CRE-GUR-5 protein [Ditylenchus destructor]|nr:CRE-GUR-5 protein [Ditylenchus destructor]
MMDAVRKAAELGIPLTEKTMNLHRFDIVYRLIGVYENIALNYCLCFFVIVVSSLIVELDEFNAGFDQLLTSTKMIPSLEADKFEETLSNRLLDSYLTHKRLGGKIAEVDRIFQYYILALVSTGLPITVLAFIINIRQRSSLSMVFTIDDVFCCFVHLVGFTVLPARVNSKFKAVQKQLYWCSIIWKQYDERIYHISQVFSEHASQLNIGLSLAGLVVITKSVIITSVSVLVPYVILCLQLNIGVSEKELYFYRGNITRFD